VLTSIHKIEEGHVGVYWVGGALLTRTTDPGLHIKLPFITTHDQVQVTLQTDTVKEIPCGTSGGAMIYFDKIEVVNRLDREKAHQTIKLYGVQYDKVWIFDKIHHEINQFCSSHSLQEVYIDKFDTLDEALAQSLQKSCDQYNTGIEIIAIRVTKPRIPEAVRRNYEMVEESKTRLLVAVENEKVTKKEEETTRLRVTMQAQREAEVAKINAEMEASVSRIAMDKEIMLKDGERQKADIENQMLLSREKAQTDAAFYKIVKESEANEARYTENFLRYTLFTSLSNNTKIYFGEKIPQIFIDFIDTEQKLTSGLTKK